MKIDDSLLILFSVTFVRLNIVLCNIGLCMSMCAYVLLLCDIFFGLHIIKLSASAQGIRARQTFINYQHPCMSLHYFYMRGSRESSQTLLGQSI